MSTIMTRSTSSVWGSARSHEHFDKRFMNGSSSATDSFVSLELNSKSGSSALMTGSRDVVCKTRAEYKANKLNRKEQTKLDSVTFRVFKEKEIAQRKFNQSERVMRAQSAKIVGRLKTLETSAKPPTRPKSYAYEKTGRPITRQNQKQIADSDDHCVMCETIQRIISEYETDSGRRSAHDNSKETSSKHTTCLFSDVQVRTFVHMLETKYFTDTPELSSRLRDSGIADAPKLTKNGSNGSKLSHEELSNSIARRKVELKIRQFCADIERYNKTHTLIPKEVQASVERSRMMNAVVMAKCNQEKHDKIKNEVIELLGLQSG